MNIMQKLIAVGLSGSLVAGGVFLVEQEGIETETYYDSGGLLTACVGYTGPELRPNQSFSLTECLIKLKQSMHKSDEQLSRLVSGTELSDGEHIAYLSFIYNVGAGNFGSSTLRKKLLAGDRVGACMELTQACHIDRNTGDKVCKGWSYVGKVYSVGLANRRAREQAICLEGVNGVQYH